MNRRGALGEGVMMIYRLVLVTIIAFVVLGLAAIYYEYNIDVKSSEAQIMARQMYKCLAPEGVVNLSRIEGYENNIFELCRINATGIYAKASIFKEGILVKSFDSGDRGAGWLRDINYQNLDNSIKKYYPSVFLSTEEGSFPVLIEDKRGDIYMEVIANE